MKVVDANVLLYAVNSESQHHDDARAWLDHALDGPQPVGFTWLVMLAFLRLSTNASIFARPLSVDEASDQLGDWLSAPSAVVLDPKASHFHLLTKLLKLADQGGNLVSDAHLAAIAIAYGAQVISYDKDFVRFAGLVCKTP